MWPIYIMLGYIILIAATTPGRRVWIFLAATLVGLLVPLGYVIYRLAMPRTSVAASNSALLADARGLTMVLESRAERIVNWRTVSSFTLQKKRCAEPRSEYELRLRTPRFTYGNYPRRFLLCIADKDIDAVRGVLRRYHEAAKSPA